MVIAHATRTPYLRYVALKILIIEPLPPALAPLASKKIYCLAATLRPETMCGQTNVWILPEGDYGAYAHGEDEVYVCAHRAARNMGFQVHTSRVGPPYLTSS